MSDTLHIGPYAGKIGCPVKAPTLGSLYSGIGGWDFAFTLCGVRVAWQCEINPFRQSVLRHHWPGVPLQADGTSEVWRPEHVDILTTACPRQAYASREPIYESIWRAIRLASPTWVVLETTHAVQEHFDRIQDGFSELGYVAGAIPVMHGDPTTNPPVNWLRVIFVAVQGGTKGAHPIRRTLLGGRYAISTGACRPNADGKLQICYGPVQMEAPTVVAALDLARSYGYPDDWLAFGPVDAGEIARAVIDSTAVAPAVELARLLTRPGWKEQC